MSSSRIIRDNDQKDATVTPYCIKEMQDKGNLRDIQAQAEAILKKAGAEREAIEMEAYRKGLEQGQTQGQMMAVKRIEPLIRTLSHTIEELKRMRHLIIEKHQDQILELKAEKRDLGMQVAVNGGQIETHARLLRSHARA